PGAETPRFTWRRPAACRRRATPNCGQTVGADKRQHEGAAGHCRPVGDFAAPQPAQKPVRGCRQPLAISRHPGRSRGQAQQRRGCHQADQQVKAGQARLSNSNSTGCRARAAVESHVGHVTDDAQNMFIAVLLIGVIICLYHLHVYQVRSRVAHIPGPPCHWFYLFGNAGELIKSKKINQRRLMLKYFKLYGPVFRLVIFHKLRAGRQPHPAEPPPAQTAAVFSMLHSMFGVRFMGRSLVAETDHGRWLQRRRQVRGIFSAEFANGSVGTINEACTALVRLLNREATGEQRLLQLESYFGKVTLEVTCRLDTAEASEMQSYVQGAMEGIAIKTESPFAWLGRPAKVAKVRRCLISLRSLLSKRVVSTVDIGVSMIDEMVNKLSGMLSKEELVDEAVTLFSAG
uniref:Cytochrome P450 n=1 Tax=Macrostomum lignano TaxID=282301 RepID=A0A1I8FGH2_9PLAT